MSSESKPNPEQNVPKIWDRDQIIILSQDEECQCGRVKNRPHCPDCSSVQKYGMARSLPIKLKNGDIMKDCRSYRCRECGKRYNDIDWYFECHAPVKMDVTATKELIKQKERQASMEWWRTRIIAMWNAGLEIKPDWNDLQKFKASVGGDFNEFAKAMIDIEKDKELKKRSVQYEKENSTDKS